MFTFKSSPSAIASRSIAVCCAEDKFFLAFSHAIFNLLFAFPLLLKSILVSFLNSSIQNFINLSSKSSPPKWVSPLVLLTSKRVSSKFKIETSKVPPPKSKISIFLSSLLLFIP